jgi:hypothetical protein
MSSSARSPSTRLLRAEQLLRDCAVNFIAPSTRVVAAFDAIYLCCLDVAEFAQRSERDEGHPYADIVIAALDFLVSARAGDSPLPAESVDLVLRLMQWSFVGVGEDMPCTPAHAVELANQVVSRTHALLSEKRGQ